MKVRLYRRGFVRPMSLVDKICCHALAEKLWSGEYIYFRMRKELSSEGLKACYHFRYEYANQLINRRLIHMVFTFYIVVRSMQLGQFYFIRTSIRRKKDGFA